MNIRDIFSLYCGSLAPRNHNCPWPSLAGRRRNGQKLKIVMAAAERGRYMAIFFFLAIILQGYVLAASIPTITIPVVQSSVFSLTRSADLWYFGGAHGIPNYHTFISLQAVGPAQGSFTWQATANPGAVDLGNGVGQPITRQNNPVLGIESSSGSATANDVTVHFQYNGSDVGDFVFTVYAPDHLTGLSNVDSVDPTYGYDSFIHYSIKDQFNNVLPYNVYINEHFTTAQVYDYSGANWRRGPEGSANVSPADWADSIQGEAAGFIPTAQNPQTPLGSTQVSHWDGFWSVGSLTIGSGKRVQGNRWQKYQDHARHTNIGP